MLRRARIIGALAVGLVAMQGGDAGAHYAQVIDGYVVHLFSLGCNTVLRQVPGTNAHPAVSVCTANVTLVECLCENPSGKDVFAPGMAGIQQTLVGQDILEEQDIDKKRGRASVSVHVSEEGLARDEYCVNPNWHAIECVSLALDATIETFECTGPDTDPCSTHAAQPASSQNLSCTAPPGFGVQNADDFVGERYNCAPGPRQHNY